MRLDQVVELRIDGRSIWVRDNNITQFVPFETLRLDKAGVIKEFPDLWDKDDWRQQAIQRFKDKIYSMRNEEEIKEYLIADLKYYGYEAVAVQRKGHRVEKLKPEVIKDE